MNLVAIIKINLSKFDIGYQLSRPIVERGRAVESIRRVRVKSLCGTRGYSIYDKSPVAMPFCVSKCQQNRAGTPFVNS